MKTHTALGLVCLAVTSAFVGCGSSVDSSSSGNAPDLPGVDGGASSGSTGGTSSGSSGTTSGSSGTSGTTSGGVDGGGRVDAGGDYNTPPVCTSGKQAAGGNNADMKPGEACNSCHKVGGAATGKVFDVAGTVYPTAHEPDDCVGLTGATVIITGKDGKDVTFPVSANGNFSHNSLFGFGAIPTPYTAKVTFNGKTREMVAPQTNGDCNSCHTEAGTQAAPGRIMAP